MYKLFYAPGTAAMVVHQTLIEIGAPFELRPVDMSSGEHKSPEYLKINPSGVVPTMLVDGKPYYEAAALVLLLTERHPEAALAPPPGSPARPAFVQWMFHFANSVQPPFRQWYNAKEFAASDSEADVVKTTGWRKIEASWNRVNDHLAAHGPHILGDTFSVCDLYATMLMRWSRAMPKPATEWPALAALATRVKSRPSWKRMYQEEGLTEWA